MVLSQDMRTNRQAFPACFFWAVGALALAVMTAVPAQADSLDAAKAAGQVVEQANGLLATCPGAPASVSGSVQSINAKRLDQYRAIAANTGAALDQVQARAGAKLRQTSPGGCK